MSSRLMESTALCPPSPSLINRGSGNMTPPPLPPPAPLRGDSSDIIPNLLSLLLLLLLAVIIVVAVVMLVLLVLGPLSRISMIPEPSLLLFLMVLLLLCS